MRASVAILLGLAVACAGGCNEGRRAADEVATPDEPALQSSEAPRRCNDPIHVVDRAVCPRLIANACASTPLAGPAELCRRLYLDLHGVGPDATELAACAGQPPRVVAERLLEDPAYVRHAQELWATTLHYDALQVHGKWLADADRIVAEMVTGKLGYDAFARRLVAHPLFGIGARRPQSCILVDDERFFPQVAHRMLEVFLGRSPIAGEDVSLAKLFRVWRKKMVMLSSDYGRADPILDPSGCPCQSTALGATTTINLPLSEPTPYEQLPPELRDRVEAELAKPGQLLVAQPAFWTHAVDIALGMYLGWWKATSDLEQSLLPELQIVLADWLRTSEIHSFRDLVLEIVTSELYVRSNRAPDEAPEALPIECTGPLRPLRPEAYVATLGKLLAIKVGRCDHRTGEKRGNRFFGTEGVFFPDVLREDESSDVSLGSVDFHQEAAQAMGGCIGGAPRTDEPTLKLVFGASDVAAKLCRLRPPVPRDVDLRVESEASAQRVRDHVAERLLGRRLSGEEEAAIAEDIRACLATPRCLAPTLAADLCTTLARSIEFLTY